MQTAQLVFRAFRRTDPKVEEILFSFKILTDGDVDHFLNGDPIFPNLIVYGVQRHHGIYALQRLVLSLPDKRKLLIRDL